MSIQSYRSQRGITLIELLVALIVFGIVSAGSYRLFVGQSKAYTVQDQVVEIQQNVRMAMERLLRDLRIAGFDDDNSSSPFTITNPIVNPLSDNSISVNYEYFDKATLQYQLRTISYSMNGSKLILQESINGVAGPQEVLLENVDALNFAYGLDGDGDGAMDDRNGNSMIDDNDWVPAGSAGTTKVIAVRVRLTARPDSINPDIQTMVSPRTLVSAVTLRNLCLK